MLTATAFWTLLAISLVANFFIFKDLADVSQWLIQSPRKVTMRVWYHRHAIAIAAIASLAGAWLIWLQDHGLCPLWLLSVFSVVLLFLFYSGYINPRLMFRPQQDRARFVAVEDARPYLEKYFKWARFGWQQYASVDDISVTVIETDSGAIAYSDYFIMQPHIVTAGTIDQQPVVMTYCSLSNAAIAYSTEMNGQPLQLGVMTQLENNLVMWDRNSGEPIQQITGCAEANQGQRPLREWPCVRMPLRSFATLYPQGKVYINEIADPRRHPCKALWDGFIRHVLMYNGISMQWRNATPAFPTIKCFDDRLPRKTLIYGLNVGDDYVAYSKEFIVSKARPINARVGDRGVVIAYSPEYDTIGAFYNDTGAGVEAIDVMGRLPSGEKLERVPTLKSAVFWFIWANFHRHTDLNRWH